MSHPLETAARFDRISEVYDETREPLGKEALDKAALFLHRDGCREILEVGVGTGRIAKPLSQRKFEIVGVDLSRGMLAKAQSKGLERLVMGDANTPPFREKAFDAVLLAHVLHLLDDPSRTFAKVSDVARKEIVALVRKRDASPLGIDAGGLLREAFREAAAEMGYVPRSPRELWRERFAREAEFLSSSPADELVTLQDVAVVTTLRERLSFLEKRAFSFTLEVPDDVFRRVMQKMRSSVDADQEIRYRRIEQMAIWRLTEKRSS